MREAKQGLNPRDIRGGTKRHNGAQKMLPKPMLPLANLSQPPISPPLSGQMQEFEDATLMPGFDYSFLFDNASTVSGELDPSSVFSDQVLMNMRGCVEGFSIEGSEASWI